VKSAKLKNFLISDNRSNQIWWANDGSPIHARNPHTSKTRLLHEQVSQVICMHCKGSMWWIVLILEN